MERKTGFEPATFCLARNFNLKSVQIHTNISYTFYPCINWFKVYFVNKAKAKPNNANVDKIDTYMDTSSISFLLIHNKKK